MPKKAVTKETVTLRLLYMMRKEELINEQDFERAAFVRDQENALGSAGNKVLTLRQQRTVRAFLKILAPSE